MLRFVAHTKKQTKIASIFQKIMTNSKHTEKSFIYNFLHPWLGTGLITSYGEKHLARRKLLTPSFHFNILKRVQMNLNKQTNILLNEIKEMELNRPEGTNIQKLMARFALNAICGRNYTCSLQKFDQT